MCCSLRITNLNYIQELYTYTNFGIKTSGHAAERSQRRNLQPHSGFEPQITQCQVRATHSFPPGRMISFHILSQLKKTKWLLFGMRGRSYYVFVALKDNKEWKLNCLTENSESSEVFLNSPMFAIQEC